MLPQYFTHFLSKISSIQPHSSHYILVTCNCSLYNSFFSIAFLLEGISSVFKNLNNISPHFIFFPLTSFLYHCFIVSIFPSKLLEKNIYVMNAKGYLRLPTWVKPSLPAGYLFMGSWSIVFWSPWLLLYTVLLLILLIHTIPSCLSGEHFLQEFKAPRHSSHNKKINNSFQLDQEVEILKLV